MSGAKLGPGKVCHLGSFALMIFAKTCREQSQPSQRETRQSREEGKQGQEKRKPPREAS